MSAAVYDVKQADAPLVRLGHVKKSFAMPDGSRFDAVRDVSLQIQRGDIVGLVGKSGAGKSTLLRLINLLERPDGGSVHLADQELTRLSRREPCPNQCRGPAWISRAACTFSRTVSDPNASSRWKVRAMPARARSFTRARVTSWSRNRT